MKNLPTYFKRLCAVAAVLLWLPQVAWAAGLAPRDVQVGSSGQSVVTSYVISATTATGASIASIDFKFCTTPNGVCSPPIGVDTTGASLLAQSGATGFTLVTTTNGVPYITRSAAVLNASTPISYTLDAVVNPSTANQTYYVRITTYTSSDATTGAIDTGTVALSTSQPVQLTGVTPEILVFCVGTTITGNCTTIAGSTIDFGDFSPTSTNSGTSVMQAQTNASNGYVISINGTTLSSGVNTIPALPIQTASAIGVSQFGLNLRANTTPAVGTEPAGAGNGAVNVNYDMVDQFRFVAGDAVAAAATPTNANTYTSSYVVNIGGAQAAGVYTATMTYICTASF